MFIDRSKNWPAEGSVAVEEGFASQVFMQNRHSRHRAGMGEGGAKCRQDRKE